MIQTIGQQNGNQCANGNSAACTLNDEAAYGYPRDFLENKFVYLLISPRARGLSVGINLNPALQCTFQCMYCELDRAQFPRTAQFDADALFAELNQTLQFVQDGGLRRHPRYSKVPEELLHVRHIALSGDGEPTLSPSFTEATEMLMHQRALGNLPPFRFVLLTNSTALDRPEVERGLNCLTRDDEVWAKLDGGTQDYLKKVNGCTVPIEKILENILAVARQRPVVIQSLFPSINGEEPSGQEIDCYARRLKKLRDSGADIPLVQIYSATRPMARTGCGHLPLKTLSRIAHTVRQVAGLRAEVF